MRGSDARYSCRAVGIALMLVACPTDGMAQWIMPFSHSTNASVQAAMSGDAGAMKTFLAEKPDINASHEGGVTLVHIAAYWGRTGVCAMLLNGGADPMKRDKEGRNALHYAVLLNECEQDLEDMVLQAGKLGVCRMLTKRKDCAIDARDAEGNTALHWASVVWPGGGSDASILPALCKELIAHGADVNATNAVGDTVLHTVADRSGKDAWVCKLLLKHGADPKAKNAAGKTPVQLAQDREEAAAVLKALRGKGKE